jgi:phosphinothricin acetyltransferase
MRTRPATLDDAPAITAIYAEAVLHGTATFDVEPPTADAIRARLEELTVGGYPYLVAERDAQVVGYAYAAPFRLRAAYASTVEDSVYIADSARGAGVGKVLLQALLAACEALGFRAMLALIGDSGSAASIGLHSACGFAHAGVLRGVGFKQERWLDVVLMERRLGLGAAVPPTR